MESYYSAAIISVFNNYTPHFITRTYGEISDDEREKFWPWHLTGIGRDTRLVLHPHKLYLDTIIALF